MKKLYILLMSAALFFVGCNDFLNLKPRDTRVVSTIEDYRDIMANYLYFIKQINPQQITVFGGFFIFPKFTIADRIVWYTGEVGVSRNSSYYFDSQSGNFSSTAVNMQTWTHTTDQEWKRFYSFLGPINMVVNGVQTAKGTNENLRQYVLGEALVWRAYSYFKLLQYYAPYKDNTYGIPICLDPTKDIGNILPKRETQTTCYKQIIGDLNTSLELLDKTIFVNNWNYTFNYDFIHAMLASIYTYKAMSGAAESTDWDNAYMHSNKAIGSRNLTNDPTVIQNIFDCSGKIADAEMKNDEFYIRIMDGNNEQLCNFVYEYGNGDINDGIVPNEYFELYTENDIRKSAYFIGNSANKYNIVGISGGAGCNIPFRLAEMYLIRAEALIRMNKIGEAKSALEAFCLKRYITLPSIPSDATALLDMILLERKKEFYMENDFRWLDMKRLGVTRETTVNGEIYKLEANDFRYSFPIPASEMKVNKEMVQTPGWEKFLLN